MSFEFIVESVVQNETNADRPKVDFDALNRYMFEEISKFSDEPQIGYVSGVIDLGLHTQEDAKMEFKGTEEDEAAELAKNPLQYFETLPNDKGVPTRYKRWAVKPCQQVALTIDFPQIQLDKGSFFGETEKVTHPLRLLLNGEFYIKGVGKTVGKPYALKEVKQDDGSWAFKNNTQLHKLAAATGSLDDKGFFKPAHLGKLLGKAALFEIGAELNKVGDKTFYNEKVKLNGKAPSIMLKGAEPLDPKYVYGVNFKGVQNPEVLKMLRVSVKNTMRQALNYAGSDLQKAMEPDYVAPEGQETGTGITQKIVQPQQPAPQAAQDFDNFDDDIPF
jgi:hypothetical protein